MSFYDIQFGIPYVKNMFNFYIFKTSCTTFKNTLHALTILITTVVIKYASFHNIFKYTSNNSKKFREI